MVIREEVPMAGWSLGTNKAEALHYSNQVFSEILLLTQVLRPAGAAILSNRSGYNLDLTLCFHTCKMSVIL